MSFKYNRETRRLAQKIGAPPSIMLAMQSTGLLVKGQHRVPARAILNFLKLETRVKHAQV